MNDAILFGHGRDIVELPRSHWEGHLSKVPEVMRKRLAFMTPQHHLVRYYVVKELPRSRSPITPETIAQNLSLPVDRVQIILEELERNLFFLVRNRKGAVAWAFPVTTDKTPHQVALNTGDRIYAA
jgi:hypothetical protein